MGIADLARKGDLVQTAETATAVPDGAYVAEPKFDGWRLVAHVHDAGVTLYARSGAPVRGQLPHIEAELADRFPVGTWLDGEAVALRIDGERVVNEWGTAQSVLSKVGPHAAADRITFMVFDLIAHADIDARPLPLATRRKLLERIFEAKDFNAIQLTCQFAATTENHERMVKLGFEGTVVKALAAPYASGKRGRGWTKIKPQTRIEVVVMGFEPGKNGIEGLVGAIRFGQYENDELVERGTCSGFDMRTRVDMTEHPERYIGKVIEIAHHGVGIGGKPTNRFRSPQFKRWRPDRKAESVGLHDA